MVSESLESRCTYYRALLGAGLEGIASARRERNGRILERPVPPVLWPLGAAGGVIAVIGTRLFGKRKSLAATAIGALVGSITGCGAAMIWASRGFIVPASRSTAQHVNAVRDAHWLQVNPIDYA